MQKLKIYIVDDHKLFREGLKLLLSTQDFVQHIYEASSGDEFVENLSFFIFLRALHATCTTILQGSHYMPVDMAADIDSHRKSRNVRRIGIDIDCKRRRRSSESSRSDSKLVDF